MDNLEEPRVSVIVPAYNAASYIRETLDSILAQTYKNLETIVIDDGSTDDTYKIIENEYRDVRCIRTDQGGPARARNIGIMNSDGEFIAFLDADDIWRPEKLEKQVKEMVSNPQLGLTFTESGIFNASGISIASLNKRRRLMEGDIVKNIFWKSGVATPSVMVRRSILEEVGYFEEDLVCSEDDNLWMRIAMSAPISLIDEQLVLIRARDNSLSQTSGNMFSGVKRQLELLETKYPELKARLGNLVEHKHAVLHIVNGLDLLNQDQPRAARRDFFLALQYRPMHAATWVYCGVTFLPVSMIAALRRIKQQLFKKISHSWLRA
jgi:glycosyltransferase involved in cell wall biosynthesis